MKYFLRRLFGGEAEGTTGGHRHEGHGSWPLLAADGETLEKGRLECPLDRHVADTGTLCQSGAGNLSNASKCELI